MCSGTRAGTAWWNIQWKGRLQILQSRPSRALHVMTEKRGWSSLFQFSFAKNYSKLDWKGQKWRLDEQIGDMKSRAISKKAIARVKVSGAMRCVT